MIKQKEGVNEEIQTTHARSAFQALQQTRKNNRKRVVCKPRSGPIRKPITSDTLSKRGAAIQVLKSLIQTYKIFQLSITAQHNLVDLRF